MRRQGTLGPGGCCEQVERETRSIYLISYKTQGILLKSSNVKLADQPHHSMHGLIFFINIAEMRVGRMLLERDGAA